MVRAHAAEWHIDPNRIGVLGFSAGAHLAAALSTHFDQRLYDPIDASDKLSCRPDFAVIVYPGYLALADQNYAPNPDIHPTAQTPPTFIVQAEDDPVHVENAVVYFLALKNAKVPAELHIYAQGGHGYGLRRTELPVTTWPKTVEIWLHTIHVLPATSDWRKHDKKENHNSAAVGNDRLRCAKYASCASCSFGSARPGPSTDAPYAPLPILPGGVVITLYPPGSPFLNKEKVRQAEQYNMSQAVPGPNQQHRQHTQPLDRGAHRRSRAEHRRCRDPRAWRRPQLPQRRF